MTTALRQKLHRYSASNAATRSSVPAADLQCVQVAAWRIPPDEKRAVVVGETGRAAVEAAGLVNATAALALLGDLDRPAARLALARGRLDLAEQLTAASVLRWQGAA